MGAIFDRGEKKSGRCEFCKRDTIVIEIIPTLEEAIGMAAEHGISVEDVQKCTFNVCERCDNSMYAKAKREAKAQ